MARRGERRALTEQVITRDWLLRRIAEDMRRDIRRGM